MSKNIITLVMVNEIYLNINLNKNIIDSIKIIMTCIMQNKLFIFTKE